MTWKPGDDIKYLSDSGKLLAGTFLREGKGGIIEVQSSGAMKIGRRADQIFPKETTEVPARRADVKDAASIDARIARKFDPKATPPLPFPEVKAKSATLTLSPSSIADYRRFLRAKSLPVYKLTGRTISVPEEYAGLLTDGPSPRLSTDYKPLPGLFDYQKDIASVAVRKRKYAAFVAPGLGKTLIETEFARHAASQLPGNQCVLMFAPPMVIPQTMAEIQKFYGDSFPIEHVSAKYLSTWLTSGDGKIGITNYETLKEETPQGRLGGIVADESSIMKSHYGKWGQILIRLGEGLEWKLCGTGTPAPNDRIEFANHAVFLDQFPTVNSFLARFFVNRGQTQERWSIKPHALQAFYRQLSHWCIFMENPATYGWKDNSGTLPPIRIHIHEVDLSADQQAAVRDVTGDLFGTNPGGITKRSTLGQLAKGKYNGKAIETLKPQYIRDLVNQWPGESTLIWCKYNDEQEGIEKVFPGAASIKGATKDAARLKMVEDFKAGRTKILISKPEILGFGLNLQICTRQVFSGLQDSYEEFYQAVKRSNRVGSTIPLNVHIPVTSVERPMVETVLQKAARVTEDAAEQERFFKESGYAIAA